tara:strand:- start:1410 stop:1700 length:291 start_codon:yes stop_codon:yes gene_type:complete
MSNKYNGWTNYETWNVNLWLSNDEGTYNYILDLAKDHADDAPMLANALEAFVDELEPELEPSMFSDILSAAMREVNWREIADTLLEDHKDELVEAV